MLFKINSTSQKTGRSKIKTMMDVHTHKYINYVLHTTTRHYTSLHTINNINKEQLDIEQLMAVEVKAS